MTIASTPGIASAALVSIATIRAWACGLRSTAPCNSSLGRTSAPNTAAPITLSTPSGRTGREPTTRYGVLDPGFGIGGLPQPASAGVRAGGDAAPFAQASTARTILS